MSVVDVRLWLGSHGLEVTHAHAVEFDHFCAPGAILAVELRLLLGVIPAAGSVHVVTHRGAMKLPEELLVARLVRTKGNLHPSSLARIF